MSFARSSGIALRIIQGLRRDRRTLALLVVVPVVIMSLVGLSFNQMPQVLDFIAPAVIAVFVFLFSFMLTGVSFLRERASGTLERLLATPVGRADLLIGYLLGFLGFALVQATVILLFTVYVLDVTYRTSFLEVFLFLAILTVTGVSLGVALSTFARNEFQIVQFIPLFFAPQIFLSGIFLPVEEMHGFLQAIATVIPLRYAIDGLRLLMLEGAGLLDVAKELAVLGGIAVGALIMASITVRRV